MTYTKAKIYLARACRNGYVPYYNGIVCFEDRPGHINNHGINIDGDGHDGRDFGCPEIIWDEETAERRFPTRRREK